MRHASVAAVQCRLRTLIHLEGLLVVRRNPIGGTIRQFLRLPVRALYIVALITGLMRNIGVYVCAIVSAVVLHAVIVWLRVALVRSRSRVTRSLIILSVLILGLMWWTLKSGGWMLLGVHVLAFALIGVRLVVLPSAVHMLWAHHVAGTVTRLLASVGGTLEAGLDGRANMVRARYAGMLRAVVRGGARTAVRLLPLRRLHHLIAVALLVAVILLIVRVQPLLRVTGIVLLRNRLLILVVVRQIRNSWGLR